MKDSMRAKLSKSRARVRRELEPVRRRLQGVLGQNELATALGTAGVTPGATVMAHVSMNEVRRTAPTVDPLSLIALLKELLTPSGTLMVMTSPFTGFQAEYAAAKPIYDVRRTPSRMGLMTELFRRMPDTKRSLHPTHPVAGWGRHAEELLASHHEGETFAETSPFCLMRDYGGVVVGIGASIRNGFTIIHSAEWLHARDRAFASESLVLQVRDRVRTFDYAFRPLRTDLDRRVRTIERKLRGTGALRYFRYSGLLIASGVTETFIDRTGELIADGSFYR